MPWLAAQRLAFCARGLGPASNPPQAIFGRIPNEQYAVLKLDSLLILDYI